MTIEVDEKVLVSQMSAPARKYCRWMARMASGWVRIEQVVVAAHVLVPVLEPLAAIAGLVAA